jgi:hypothetical protein
MYMVTETFLILYFPNHLGTEHIFITTLNHVVTSDFIAYPITSVIPIISYYTAPTVLLLTDIYPEDGNCMFAKTLKIFHLAGLNPES